MGTAENDIVERVIVDAHVIARLRVTPRAGEIRPGGRVEAAEPAPSFGSGDEA